MPNNQYGKLSGTSMAAPMITGVIALVLSTYGPEVVPDIKERIIGTSRRFKPLYNDARGGIIDAFNAITGQLSFDFWVHPKKNQRPLW